MKVEFQKVFKFDLERSRAVEIQIQAGESDFSEYLNELTLDVLADAHSKRYLFPEASTDIMTDINSIINDNKKDATAQKIATRLMHRESSVQSRIEHLKTEVQKGIMVQTLVKLPEQNYFLIIKAEHFDFINENDSKKATGLPIKRKIFKAFSAHLGSDDSLSHAMVSDYKTVISTYWWRDFLELSEEHTDQYNTEKSFDALDRKFSPQ